MADLKSSGPSPEVPQAASSAPKAAETMAGARHSSEPTPSPNATTKSAAELPEQFGRYRIVKRLGKGGMGSVYLAHDSQLDRKVALKVPHFDPEDGERVLERFYREARAAATLDHANLCPVQRPSLRGMR